MKQLVAVLLVSSGLAACGGSGGNDNSGGGDPPVVRFSVFTNVATNGSVTPVSMVVDSGATADFTITPDAGYTINNVSGCGGTLSGTTYTTGAIIADCTIKADFSAEIYSVSANVGPNGNVDPSSANVPFGSTAEFVINPDTSFTIDSVSGCGGVLIGNTYTIAAADADCTIDVSFIPLASVPTLSLQQTKIFRVSWADVPGATHYRLLENADGMSGFSQVGTDIPFGTQQYDHVVPLYERTNAQYILESCFDLICNDSDILSVSGSLEEAVGYIKASNTGVDDLFGGKIELSGDGNTLVVGVPLEDSNSTGINGNQNDDSSTDSGAVYIYARTGNTWSPQAYIKASNAETNDYFGVSVGVSSDGSILAVGALGEGSSATGINGNQSDNTAFVSGAVYVFSRNGSTWSQQAYIKASNTGSVDRFGTSVSLNSDGTLLAVGAYQEDSSATGVNGDQGDNSAMDSGAAYVFHRSGTSWIQQAYLKASNTDGGDGFGGIVRLSGDGQTLAVTAQSEESSATGIDGNQNDNSAIASGAVYVFVQSGGLWTQQAYIKASNTETGDSFGSSIGISSDGATLAVGAMGEQSDATGVDGSQANGSIMSFNSAGAAYVFTRTGATWSQQAYIKASNTEGFDLFGQSLDLSDDGNSLAVGAPWEDGDSRGIGGLNGNAAQGAGAVYFYTRNGDTWNSPVYIKASNTPANSIVVSDQFGYSVSLNSDSSILAVGANAEESTATGVNGDQTNNSASDAGAVYLY